MTSEDLLAIYKEIDDIYATLNRFRADLSGTMNTMDLRDAQTSLTNQLGYIVKALGDAVIQEHLK